MCEPSKSSRSRHENIDAPMIPVATRSMRLCVKFVVNICGGRSTNSHLNVGLLTPNAACNTSPRMSTTINQQKNFSIQFFFQ